MASLFDDPRTLFQGLHNPATGPATRQWALEQRKRLGFLDDPALVNAPVYTREADPHVRAREEWAKTTAAFKAKRREPVVNGAETTVGVNPAEQPNGPEQKAAPQAGATDGTVPVAAARPGTPMNMGPVRNMQITEKSVGEATKRSGNLEQRDPKTGTRIYDNFDLDRVRESGPSRGGFMQVTETSDPKYVAEQAALNEMKARSAVAGAQAMDPTGQKAEERQSAYWKQAIAEAESEWEQRKAQIATQIEQKKQRITQMQIAPEEKQMMIEALDGVMRAEEQEFWEGKERRMAMQGSLASGRGLAGQFFTRPKPQSYP
jgi:hypothetical protein